VEWLKVKGLSSNPSTGKKPKKTKTSTQVLFSLLEVLHLNELFFPFLFLVKRKKRTALSP
jgi:hypothetical protein